MLFWLCSRFTYIAALNWIVTLYGLSEKGKSKGQIQIEWLTDYKKHLNSYRCTTDKTLIYYIKFT